MFAGEYQGFQILVMFQDLDEEKKRDILKYIEKEKRERALGKWIKQRDAKIEEGV